jgi:hypothetical protein
VRRALTASPALAAALLALCACRPVRKRGASKVTLAVLPAESDKFPGTAKAITASLAEAEVAGVDDKQVANVSLEVAQLSIECVEPTVVCYAKVGQSLEANRLLFAEIGAEGKKRVEITITLFDVDARKPRSVRRVFASEKEATANVSELVREATR